MVIQEHFLRWKWNTILLVHILSFFEKCTRGDWFACYWVQVQQEENHVLHFHKKCWSCRRRGEPYIRQDGKIRLMTTLVLETFPSILLRAIILTSIIKKYSLRSQVREVLVDTLHTDACYAYRYHNNHRYPHKDIIGILKFTIMCVKDCLNTSVSKELPSNIA